MHMIQINCAKHHLSICPLCVAQVCWWNLEVSHVNVFGSVVFTLYTLHTCPSWKRNLFHIRVSSVCPQTDPRVVLGRHKYVGSLIVGSCLWFPMTSELIANKQACDTEFQKNDQCGPHMQHAQGIVPSAGSLNQSSDFHIYSPQLWSGLRDSTKPREEYLVAPGAAAPCSLARRCLFLQWLYDT